MGLPIALVREILSHSDHWNIDVVCKYYCTKSEYVGYFTKRVTEAYNYDVPKELVDCLVKKDMKKLQEFDPKKLLKMFKTEFLYTNVIIYVINNHSGFDEIRPCETLGILFEATKRNFAKLVKFIIERFKIKKKTFLANLFRNFRNICYNNDPHLLKYVIKKFNITHKDLNFHSLKKNHYGSVFRKFYLMLIKFCRHNSLRVMTKYMGKPDICLYDSAKALMEYRERDKYTDNNWDETYFGDPIATWKWLFDNYPKDYFPFLEILKKNRLSIEDHEKLEHLIKKNPMMYNLYHLRYSQRLEIYRIPLQNSVEVHKKAGFTKSDIIETQLLIGYYWEKPKYDGLCYEFIIEYDFTENDIDKIIEKQKIIRKPLYERITDYDLDIINKIETYLKDMIRKKNDYSHVVLSCTD